ncbi:MAG TPA: hypothetical protein VEK07_06785, partial [Polyangiaceae bacterium]|nr:hypothetical protein [Polyangiaceae bacterium]
MPAQRSIGERLAMGVIAGLVAFGLAYAIGPHRPGTPRARAVPVLETANATFELRPGASQLTLRSHDASVSRDIDLAVLVDGVRRPLVLSREDLHSGTDSLAATIALSFGDATVDAKLALRSDRGRDAVALELRVPSDANTNGHSVALSAELTSEGEVVFVAGVGQI